MVFRKRAYTKTKKVFIYGSGTALALFTFIQIYLSVYGFTITDWNGQPLKDLQCAGNSQEPCLWNISICASNYSLVINAKTQIYMNDSVASYTLKKQDTLGRMRVFNLTGKTLTNNTCWKLQLNITKPIDRTVKWGILTGNIEVDPKAIGYTPTDFFITLVENKADLTGGYAVFEFRNPTSFDISIDSNKFNVFTKFVAGKNINSVKIYNLTIKVTSLNVTDYLQTCYPYYLPNSTQIGNCTAFPSGWHWENKTYEDWKEFNTMTFKAKKSYVIKVVATWPAHMGEQKIEWFPLLNVGGTEFINRNWAWWNTSYTACRNITITENSGVKLYKYAVFVNLTFAEQSGSFQTIRFVDTYCNNGGNQLYHWSERNVSNALDEEWVNVTYLANSANTLISVYYNSSDTGQNGYYSGIATFLNFESFEDGSSSDAGDFWVTGNNQANVTSPHTGQYCLRYLNATIISKSQSISWNALNKQILTFWYKIGNGNTQETQLDSGGTFWGDVGVQSYTDTSGNVYVCSAAGCPSWADSGLDASTTAWNKMEWRIYNATQYNISVNRIYASTNKTLRNTLADVSYFGIGTQTAAGYVWYDDFYVRNYTGTEPTYSVSAPETYTAPTTVLMIWANRTAFMTPYNNTNSYFNISWQNVSESFSKCVLETNITGNTLNYTMNTVSQNSTHTDCGYVWNMPPGYFQYRFMGNTTTIGNATNMLWINFTKGSLTIGAQHTGGTTYPVLAGITATYTDAGGDGDVNFTFWRNTTPTNHVLVSSALGTAPSGENYVMIPDDYSWRHNTTGGANWSAGDSGYLTVTFIKGTQTLTINTNTTNPATYPTATSTAGAGCTFGIGFGTDVTCTLYRGNSSISTTANDSISLGVGYYAYNYSTEGGTNWTSSSATNLTLSIVKGTPAIFLVVNRTNPIYYGNVTNVTCYVTNRVSSPDDGVVYTQYRGNTTFNQAFTGGLSKIEDNKKLAVGIYSYNCSTLGNANWTSASATNVTLDIEKSIPNVKTFLNNATINKTITYGTSVIIAGNSTTTDMPPTFNLYAGKTSIGAGNERSINITMYGGTNQIVYNTSGNANWTTATNNTLYLIVNNQTSTVNLAFDGRENNRNYTYPQISNATGWLSAGQINIQSGWNQSTNGSLNYYWDSPVWAYTPTSGWLTDNKTNDYLWYNPISGYGIKNVTIDLGTGTNYTAVDLIYFANSTSVDWVTNVTVWGGYDNTTWTQIGVKNMPADIETLFQTYNIRDTVWGTINRSGFRWNGNWTYRYYRFGTQSNDTWTRLPYEIKINTTVIASAYLLRNGTTVITGSPASEVLSLAIGTYNYTYIYEGNENYTSSLVQRILMVRNASIMIEMPSEKRFALEETTADSALLAGNGNWGLYIVNWTGIAGGTNITGGSGYGAWPGNGWWKFSSLNQPYFDYATINIYHQPNIGIGYTVCNSSHYCDCSATWPCMTEIYYSLNQTWSEHNITWNDQPNYDNYPIERKNFTTSSEWSNWNVTSTLKTILSNVSFMIRIPMKNINLMYMNFSGSFNKSYNASFEPYLLMAVSKYLINESSCSLSSTCYQNGTFTPKGQTTSQWIWNITNIGSDKVNVSAYWNTSLPNCMSHYLSTDSVLILNAPYCQNIPLDDPLGSEITRTNEPFITWINSSAIDNGNIKIYNDSCGSGIEVPSQIIKNDTSGNYQVFFFANKTANVATNWSARYTSGGSAPIYTVDSYMNVTTRTNATTHRIGVTMKNKYFWLETKSRQDPITGTCFWHGWWVDENATGTWDNPAPTTWDTWEKSCNQLGSSGYDFATPQGNCTVEYNGTLTAKVICDSIVKTYYHQTTTYYFYAGLNYFIYNISHYIDNGGADYGFRIMPNSRKPQRNSTYYSSLDGLYPEWTTVNITDDWGTLSPSFDKWAFERAIFGFNVSGISSDTAEILFGNNSFFANNYFLNWTYLQYDAYGGNGNVPEFAAWDIITTNLTDDGVSADMLFASVIEQRAGAGIEKANMRTLAQKLMNPINTTMGIEQVDYNVTNTTEIIISTNLGVNSSQTFWGFFVLNNCSAGVTTNASLLFNSSMWWGY